MFRPARMREDPSSRLGDFNQRVGTTRVGSPRRPSPKHGPPSRPTLSVDRGLSGSLTAVQEGRSSLASSRVGSKSSTAFRGVVKDDLLASDTVDNVVAEVSATVSQIRDESIEV